MYELSSDMFFFKASFDVFEFYMYELYQYYSSIHVHFYSINVRHDSGI